MGRFEGKTVWITGSTRGIGLAVAKRFAEEGACVAVCGRSGEDAQKVAEELGEGCVGFGLDVSDRESIETTAKAVLVEFGGLDVLVNNAGITRDNLVLRMKPDDWNDVIVTNLTGAFLCSKAVIRAMMKTRSGAIVNISSVVAGTGNPGQPNYCASKAGLEGLTRSMALEYADRNVRVNCVAPGFIETDMTDELDKKTREALQQRIPLSRLGSGDDIAEAIMFLASDGACYITGQVLHVNGGMYLG